MAELVSTIIPVYNRAFFLKEAVDSVLCQVYRPIEIIIVDDGSTDTTKETIDDLVLKYPDIIKAVHQDNGGPGKARETGRQLVKGKFIQYLDSDDILLPNKFKDQVQAFEKNPGCGIAYGQTRLVDENNDILEAPYKETGNNHFFLFPKLLTLRWWNTHTPLYRKSVCDRIGQWQSMRMGEDWYYDASAGALRIKLINCHSYVSHHRQHNSERLTTGGMDINKLENIAKLLPFLNACAFEAGVPENDPEWYIHYCQVFLEMRRTADAGLKDQSEKLFELLKESSKQQIISKAIAYRLVKKIIGPHKSNQFYDMAASLKQWIKNII